jgi:hypothetical protein
MPTKTDQLYAALDQASSQVPYTLTRTPEGFRVELDLFTPAVMQRTRQLSVNRTFAIDVKLDERKRKAKLTDSLKELTWGPGNTSGLHLGGSLKLHKGAVIGTTFSFGGSDEDKARAEEMKLFTITAAKAWVRELLEANGWKVGGIGALFG